MSLLKLFSFHLIFTLSVFTLAESADEYYTRRWLKCIYSSPDLSDMVYIDGHYFNKYLFTQFNSTLGKFVGFSEYGMRVAEYWNNGSFLQAEIAGVDGFCKYNAQIYDSTVREKAVKPKVKLSSVTQAGGRHPAVLMCSAYEFYPQHIKVSWLRDGKLMTSEVTSTMEMANGDWYYQIHSELEYTPKSGEKISCLVEHASFNKPMIYDWDPSLPESERNKIAIGSSGLVLGIILAAAGFIYYKKKSSGRILVPN
ncbi:H-2 class II histocompatibility antigen, E-S beta chain-like [Pimephales promelas]|uniref:H-2 class II histocompatibility antigen, E-S beta chain-like n=1 Tax=Pimephales promelas TaxID=90988 RepID=UPI001955ED4E|nr:H-2 class II histocompatibility antigen, E-S beta chain-like [Pimephales promelas]KAG1951018.1 major histocompatibility complex class II integral membrane beta chain [Pimephales promelas]